MSESSGSSPRAPEMEPFESDVDPDVESEVDDVLSPKYEGNESVEDNGEEAVSATIEDELREPELAAETNDNEQEDGEDEEDGQQASKKSGAAFLDGAAQEADEEDDDLIADIFGQSDDEEEFTGFELNRADKRQREDEDDDLPSKRRRQAAGSDSDSDPGVIDPLVQRSSGYGSEGGGTDDERPGQPGARSGMYDFDLMMERKKMARRRRRRPKGDAVTGADDRVVALIADMRLAAEEDRLLNNQHQAATKKLKLLAVAVCEMQKADQQMTFVDEGGLSVLAEWLSPLPDRSLPHIKIREALLKWLCTLPELSQMQLKMSNIGRAVMFLYRHPRETAANRKLAGKLINGWSRVIFGLAANYKSMSRDEREERDYLQMKQHQKQRRSSTDGESIGKSVSSGLLGDSGQALKPGDKGFVGRARVPLPSNKDYIVRPKWNIDHDPNIKGKKELNRFEKQRLKARQSKQLSRVRRAATISLVGTKMPL